MPSSSQSGGQGTSRSRVRSSVHLLALAAVLASLLPARCFLQSPFGRIMGQGIATTQFYLYGRRHFTQTGWEQHSAEYPSPDPLDSADLSGRVYVITGANAGLGREVTRFLASKGAKILMVCRSQERGDTARSELITEGLDADRLAVLQGDMGLQQDVRRVASRVLLEAPSGIDGLVCNAGALMNERMLTAEGIEVTFASHFLFGSYLLTKLLLPALRKASANGREPRVIHVSSGGMYNVAFPAWEIAASIPDPDSKEAPAYNGQLAYAYAKRGQVLLCERWAELEKSSGEEPVTFVSAHPGWAGTKGVTDAYGESTKWLEPMRNSWQGAEGICWLCWAPASELEPGAFYLDRSPQVKHLAGPFFTEGWFTQNTREDVDEMMSNAERYAPIQ